MILPIIIIQMYQGNEPTTLSPRGSEQSPSEPEALQLEVSSIIKSEREKQTQQADQILEVLDPISVDSCPSLSILKQPQMPSNLLNHDKELQELQLEMLVEECEELIGKIAVPSSQEETTLNLELEQSGLSTKKQKQRLEKEYFELCMEIERQQRELNNYKFKVQVAHREADYYTRQIKQKTQILKNLEQHQFKKKRK